MTFVQTFSHWIAASRTCAGRTPYVVSMSDCGWPTTRSGSNHTSRSGADMRYASLWSGGYLGPESIR